MRRGAFLISVWILLREKTHAVAVRALRWLVTTAVLDDRRIVRIFDGLKTFAIAYGARILVLQPFLLPLEFHQNRTELSLGARIKTIEILPLKQGSDQSLGEIVKSIGL